MKSSSILSRISGDLGLMILTTGFLTMVGQLVWPFKAIYILLLGGNYFHIGVIAALGALASVVPSLLGGYYADFATRRELIWVMNLTMAAIALLYSYALDWVWILVISVLDAMAFSFRQPALNALVADSTDFDNRAQCYALWSVLPPLFGFASPLFMGVLSERYDTLNLIRFGYKLLFYAYILSSVLLYFFLDKNDRFNKTQKVRPTVILKNNFLKDLVGLIRELPIRMWALTLMGVLCGLGSSLSGPFWITYATVDVIHLSFSEWGTIIGVNTILSTIISFPIAKIADEKGRWKILSISLLLTPLTIIGFINCRGFLQTCLLCAAMTVISCMGMTSSQALFADLSYPCQRGRLTAIWGVLGVTQSFNLNANFVSFISSPLSFVGGYLYNEVAKALPLYTQSFLVLMTGLIGLAFMSEIPLIGGSQTGIRFVKHTPRKEQKSQLNRA